jgi:hypothetical protein
MRGHRLAEIEDVSAGFFVATEHRILSLSQASLTSTFKHIGAERLFLSQ